MKLENVSQYKATTSKISKTKIHLNQSQTFLADEIELFTKKREYFLGFFLTVFFLMRLYFVTVLRLRLIYLLSMFAWLVAFSVYFFIDFLVYRSQTRNYLRLIAFKMRF